MNIQQRPYDGDFQLDRWNVDAHGNQLLANGYTVRLEPKVMEVLLCLAMHAGEVVEKDQLMREVWRDTFVTHDSLKRCVSILRRVLSDKPNCPRIIETIPKRGYRLCAPIMYPSLGKSQGNNQRRIALVLLPQSATASRIVSEQLNAGETNN